MTLNAGPSDRDGELRLPHAGCTGDRHHRHLLEELVDACGIALTAHEVSIPGREVGPRFDRPALQLRILQKDELLGVSQCGAHVQPRDVSQHVTGLSQDPQRIDLAPTGVQRPGPAVPDGLIGRSSPHTCLEIGKSILSSPERDERIEAQVLDAFSQSLEMPPL